MSDENLKKTKTVIEDELSAALKNMIEATTNYLNHDSMLNLLNLSTAHNEARSTKHEGH